MPVIKQALIIFSPSGKQGRFAGGNTMLSKVVHLPNQPEADSDSKNKPRRRRTRKNTRP